MKKQFPIALILVMCLFLMPVFPVAAQAEINVKIGRYFNDAVLHDKFHWQIILYADNTFELDTGDYEGYYYETGTWTVDSSGNITANIVSGELSGQSVTITGGGSDVLRLWNAPLYYDATYAVTPPTPPVVAPPVGQTVDPTDSAVDASAPAPTSTPTPAPTSIPTATTTNTLTLAPITAPTPELTPEPASTPATENQINLIDTIEPSSYTDLGNYVNYVLRYPTSGEESLTLAGESYKNSLALLESPVTIYADFDLEGKYSSLNGKVGMSDAAGRDENDPPVTANIYGDDKLLKTVDINIGDLPVDLSIDVGGVRMLKFEIALHALYRATVIGFIDLKLQ